jgi:MFS family permease
MELGETGAASREPRVSGLGLQGWMTLGILLIFNVIAYCDRLIMTMLVGPIKADLGIDDIQMGLLIGISFALFYAICGLPMGVLVDRVSRRKVLFWGMAAWSAMTAACGMAANFAQLMVARMGVGVGEATLAPAAQSLLAEKFPRERLTLAYSVFMMGAVLGAGAAIAIGGTLVHAALEQGDTIVPLLGRIRPWQMVFLWLGLAGVVLSPLILLVREPALPKPAERSELGLGALWRLIGTRPSFFVIFLLTQGILNILVNGAAAWFPEYAFRQLGQTPATIAIPYGSLMALAGVLSHLFSGSVIDWMVRRGVRGSHIRYQIGTLSIGIPVMAMGLLHGSLGGFYVALGAFFFAVGTFVAYAAAALQMVTPSTARGKMAAFYTLVIALFGQGVGPVLTPFVNSVFFAGQSLNKAIATQSLIGLAIVIGLLLLAYRPYEELLREQRA